MMRDGLIRWFRNTAWVLSGYVRSQRRSYGKNIFIVISKGACSGKTEEICSHNRQCCVDVLIIKLLIVNRDGSAYIVHTLTGAQLQAILKLLLARILAKKTQEETLVSS